MSEIKKRRSANFSRSASKVLLRLIKERQKYLDSKEMDGPSIKLKNQVWDELTVEYNNLCPDPGIVSRKQQ